MEDFKSDPPILFLRVGWMTRYKGLSATDTISGGGAYVDEHGFGSEIFNFLPYSDSVFGYVQPPARDGKWQDSRLKIERLGAGSRDDKREGVLVVWMATSPLGGAYVIGWYNNATVYRAWQPPPRGSQRSHGNDECGYYVSAQASDATLLPPDERTFALPSKGNGGPGQSNVWYADDPRLHGELRRNVLEFIRTRHLPTSPGDSRGGLAQADPLQRQQVETRAVEIVRDHYQALGYAVHSVEKDNAGWDLEASLGARRLRVEVKGLSGTALQIGLTPNEYRAMSSHRGSFRLCIVANALSEPSLNVFSYTPELGRWQSSEGLSLHIEEIVGAICLAG